METVAQSQQPIIISSGSGSATKTVAVLIGIGAALYFGNNALKAYKERHAEQEMDTPEGQIALQLKNVFASTIVSDEDFRRVYLQVNSTNKDKVVTLYRELTGRNLSDDIAEHIKTDTVTKAAKTEAINNKKDGVIKISPSDEIEFLIAHGSKVVFTDPNKAVTLYASPKGLIWNLTANEYRPQISAYDKIKVTLIGRKDTMIVDKVMTLPYDGAKFVTDWTKYIRPVVKTRKVFAIARIGIKAKDSTLKYLWVDARELSKITGLKGIEGSTLTQLAF